MTQSHDYATDDQKWAAGRARDVRADGLFWTGVLTTGVYCRPSCPGRPLRKNVRWFDSPAAARAAGLRACKRCRPDQAGETLTWGVVPTRHGLALAARSPAGLCAVILGEDKTDLEADLAERFSGTGLVHDQAAMAGDLAAVKAAIEGGALADDLALDERGTPLQRTVWAALREIPAGRTASYADVARRIGRPTAMRAVAQACGANPLAVITPCHRVIRADGSISGYRWGVERKRALLAQEARA